MAWIKKIARKAEKKVFGSGGAKRRYGIGKGKGGFNFKNVLKDIESIKGMLNVEKKYKDFNVQTGVCGQVNLSTDGMAYLNVTPIISQNTSGDGRVGNSLKMTGVTFPFQFTNQTNCIGARKIRVLFFKVNDPNNVVTPSQVISDYFDTNPLTGVIDYNSSKAYRTAKQDGIKLIRQQTYYLKAPADAGSDTAIQSSERQVTTVKFNLKLNDILRYNANADSQPDGTRYFMFIQCDAGNIGGTSSTRDVPIIYPFSGIEYRVSSRWWWVDN